jgi:hypothetical protein
LWICAVQKLEMEVIPDIFSWSDAMPCCGFCISSALKASFAVQQISAYTVKSAKTTLLPWAAQVFEAFDARAVQEHRRTNPSVQLEFGMMCMQPWLCRKV